MALGGGGFSEEPNSAALNDYVLDAAGCSRPKICFLPTAGGDNSCYLVKFYGAFAGKNCDPSHLALVNRTVDDVRAVLLAQDVIYVGGGNTVNLLAVWRAHGIDLILREAWQRGVVLCGSVRRIDVLVRERRDGLVRHADGTPLGRIRATGRK